MIKTGEWDSCVWFLMIWAACGFNLSYSTANLLSQQIFVRSVDED